MQILPVILSRKNQPSVVRNGVELDPVGMIKGILNVWPEWMGLADSPKITSCENVCYC